MAVYSGIYRRFSEKEYTIDWNNLIKTKWNCSGTILLYIVVSQEATQTDEEGKDFGKEETQEMIKTRTSWR